MEIIRKIHDEVMLQLHIENSANDINVITMQKHISRIVLDDEYKKLFVRLMHIHEHINYIQFRDCFSSIIDDDFREKSQLSSNHLSAIFRGLHHFRHGYNSINELYSVSLCTLLYCSYEYHHILMCSVPEYVTCCYDMTAKYRSTIANIHEHSCNMPVGDVIARRVFADEFIASSIALFL